MDLDTFRLKLAEESCLHESELNQLHRFLQQAQRGNGTFVVIRGVSGSGTLNLMHCFERKIEASGDLLAKVNFEKANQYSPYAPFFKIIEELNRNSVTPEYEQIVTQFRNDSKIQTGDLESLYSLQTESGLIQQKVSDALLKVAHTRLCVVVVSNVHLAPATTWLFFHYLSKRIVQHKLLFVISLQEDAREVTPEKKKHYEDVLQRMNRERLIEKIEPGQISHEQFRHYLKQVFSRSDFSRQFFSNLYKITGGMPGYLEKCLIQLFDQKIIFEENGIWFGQEELPKAFISGFVVDNDYYKQAVENLKLVSGKIKVLLQYAALAENNMDFNLLAGLLELPRRQVIKELLSLKAKKIFVETTPETFDFSSSALRLHVRHQIPEKNLNPMRLEIARRLEAMEDSAQNHKMYILAQLYEDAGERILAFQYLWKAFDIAVSNLAFNEAKDFSDRFEKIFPAVPEEEYREEYINAMIKAAWLNRVLGFYAEALSCCEQALTFCVNGQTKLENQILIQQGLTWFRLNQWEKSQDCFLKSLQINDDNFISAFANYGLGNIYIELAEFGKAQQHYQATLEMAQKISAKALIAQVYNNLGIIANIQENRMKAISFYSQSIPIFQSLNDNLGLARIYHNIGMTYADEENWEQANDFYSQSLCISDMMGFIPLKSITFLSRAFSMVHLNRIDEAKEYNYKAYILLERLKDTLGLAEYFKIQGLIDKASSNLADAEKNLITGLEKFVTLENKLGIAEIEYELGLLNLARQDHQKSVFWLNRSRDGFQNLGKLGKVMSIEKYLVGLEV